MSSEIITKFNNQLEQFLDEIKKTHPEFKENIDNLYIFPNNNSKYIEDFINNCKDNVEYILHQNEIIFSETNTIIEGVNFSNIWNDNDIDDDFKNIIWKYIYTLYIFSFEYSEKKDLTTIINESNTNDSNDEYKMFIAVLSKFKGEFVNISSNIQNIVEKELEKQTKHENSDNKESVETADVNTTSSEKEEDKQNTDSTMPDMSDMFGGVIGDLAQQLAEEINPDDLNLDNPSELLNNLMSPENGEDNKLVDLVKNITSKIGNKISSGEIDQNQLFTEATQLMGSIAGISS